MTLWSKLSLRSMNSKNGIKVCLLVSQSPIQWDFKETLMSEVMKFSENTKSENYAHNCRLLLLFGKHSQKGNAIATSHSKHFSSIIFAALLLFLFLEAVLYMVSYCYYNLINVVYLLVVFRISEGLSRWHIDCWRIQKDLRKLFSLRWRSQVCRACLSYVRREWGRSYRL